MSKMIFVNLLVKEDMGFAHLRACEGPDGHTFEPVRMNPDSTVADQR